MSISSSKIKQKFTKLKPGVISLRKSGKTYSEIRKIYNIPKSTLSSWLRYIKISPKNKREIYQRWKIRLKNLAKQKSEKALKIRLGIQNKAKRTIKPINFYSLKLIGSALYWAEGGKKQRNQLRFSNSDPEIIKVIMKFFRKVCKIPDKKIKARIHLYPQISQKKATNYWMKITDLPRENFQKPQIQISRASKGRRPKNTLPYGTVHLVILDTKKVCEVKGWIQGISEKNLVRV